MRRAAALTVMMTALSLALLAGCSNPSSGGSPQDAPRDDAIALDGVEISEYEGAKLGSVEDFRENSIAGVQQVDRDTYRLDVTGLVSAPAEYTYSEVASGYASYTKVVTLNCVEGWSVKVLWEGILLRDLLEEVNIQPSANTVILHAVDGYSTSFPIEYFYENDILLAYSMNGVTLPAERGFPFQLVAEDKWGYKWIKWISKIELSDDEEYRGYWEQRGYSDTGDLGDSFFDGN